MYKKVDSGLDFVSREQEVLEFWKSIDLTNKVLNHNNGKKQFSFYDGPPTANGKPHIGHVLTRAYKDIIPRYKTMKGYNILRKAGWDTHGLPVELEVEKQLGLDGKQDIEKYGIEEFIDNCKQSVWKYKSQWECMSERVGYMIDMQNPYITYDNNYIESVWWSLKTIFDKGLIYKGQKILPYCSRCGTALSSHEIAQGYKLVKEKTIFVAFELLDQADTFFLVWTTTPWTLPSNVAVCLNPEFDYVKIRFQDKNYILAKELVGSLFEQDSYQIIEQKKGKEYQNTRYKPLFDYGDSKKKAHYAVCDDYVTLTDGSGIVHIAPSFGEDDARVGRNNDLPFVQNVNERGRFKDNTGSISGMFIKDADKVIIKELAQRGLLFKEAMHEHNYPHCWRCDTPLMYYSRSGWFIKMTELRERLCELNNNINWIPDTIGKGRMGNFLENVVDWSVSRERYWGTPMPIWECKSCGKLHAVGSRDELKKLSGVEGEIELHRPFVDKIVFDCECGGKFVRVPEVLDCWYDSGSMPFAQFHYPFENKNLFESFYPADYICEAVDQTRGWFYTLSAISALLFDKPAFKNCIVLGHVNDKNGIKMSKSKGNAVEWNTMDKHGADAVRWYFYVNSAPWLPSRFYDEAVNEAQRKFMGTLWNTYAFFVLYADIDGFDPTKVDLKKCKLSLMDKWLLSKLNTLVKDVDDGLSKYNVTDTAKQIQNFIDMLSNWYVRCGRDRYWGSGMTEDKQAAFMTLYTALETLIKLIAPYVPFVAESIYQNLVRSTNADAPQSIHLCEFPKCESKYINEKLEKGMSDVQNIVTLGRAARNTANIKNRQPLNAIFAYSLSSLNLSDELISIVLNELNIKRFEQITSVGEYFGYEIKPQLKTLGKKYGALIPKIREHLASCDTVNAVTTVSNGGIYAFEIDGTQVELSLDDMLITPYNKQGYEAVSNEGVTVILDTALNQELVNEGIMREVVSKVQTMRKEFGLEVTNRIKLYYNCDSEIATAIQAFANQIANDVLAECVEQGVGEFTKEWQINDKSATLSISKA